MIKLLATCITLVLLYFGFSIIRQFDSDVTFTIYDYYIKITLFTLVTLFALFIVVCIFVIKIIWLIVCIPKIIKIFFLKQKDRNTHHAVVESMTEYIIGRPNKAFAITTKLLPHLTEYQEPCTLIIALTAKDTNQKIQYLQKLTESKQYDFFSLKTLAQVFLDQGRYVEAESYACRAFNLNELDSVVLEILIHCYGQLHSWRKLTFVIAKLEKIDAPRLKALSPKLAEYTRLREGT